MPLVDNIFDENSSPDDTSLPDNNAPAEWRDPQPLPSAQETPEAFDVTMIPRSFQPFVQDASERLCVDPAAVAIPLLIAAGSTIGRGLAVRPKMNDDWHEFPNLWGCVIAKPGSMKSPALDEALGPLNRLESELRADHLKRVQVWEAEFGGAEDAPAKPIEPQITAGGLTLECLYGILENNPRGVFQLRDELTSFLSWLDKPGNGEARNFYLSAASGKTPFRYQTKHQGSNLVPAVCIGLFGTIQPTVFDAWLRDVKPGQQDGFLQRLQIAAFLDNRPFELIDRQPNAEAREKVYQIFRRLRALNFDADGYQVGQRFDENKPRALGFSLSAQESFNVWIVEHQNRIQTLPDGFGAHLSKYRKTLPCIAILDSIVDGNAPENISLESWQKALRFGSYLESHARRIYSSNLIPERVSAVALGELIIHGELQDGSTVRELIRRGRKELDSPEQVHKALGVLEACGWIRVERTSNGGRPSEVIRVHPKF